jgi:hypothetical protein
VIVRNTSRYPTDEVRDLVRFATAGLDMRRVCVNVKNSNVHVCAGWAYDGVPEISNAPVSSEYLITVRLGGPERFPARLPTKKRSPDITVGCWREALVAMAAHEAKHVEQFRARAPRSEVVCERFEAWMLDRYRASANGGSKQPGRRSRGTSAPRPLR